MWRRGIVALLVAGASVLVPCQSVVLPCLPRADLNGDRQVNVLDVQAWVAASLAGGLSPANADINGDGQTDVRDLQRLIHQTSDQKEPTATRPQTRELAANIPDTVRLNRAERVPVVCAAASIAPHDAPRHIAVSDPPPERLYGGKTKRYLRGGAPHSPPGCVRFV